MRKNDPAFPNPDETNYPGMNIRTWLAGQAIQGLTTNPDCVKDLTPAFIADYAIQIADQAFQRLNNV